MRKVSMTLHGIFIILMMFQLGVIMYINKVYGSINVPIHFSF